MMHAHFDVQQSAERRSCSSKFAVSDTALSSRRPLLVLVSVHWLLCEERLQHPIWRHDANPNFLCCLHVCGAGLMLRDAHGRAMRASACSALLGLAILGSSLATLAAAVVVTHGVT